MTGIEGWIVENDDRSDIAEASRVELQELSEAAQGPKVVGRKLDLIKDVQVTVDVLLGRAELTVARLFELRVNEILELDTQLTAPVTIRLDGHSIGKGEIVVVGDRFGILITELADV